MQAESGAAPAFAEQASPVDLSDKLDKERCYARNEDKGYPWTNLLMGDTRLGCRSDADEQLILHFEFSEFVKVHSVKFTEFNHGNDPELHPTRVLLFVNRVNLGFEDIEDVDPTTTFDLTAEDLKEGADHKLLQYVRYQRVKSITVFVEENAGGDVTALGSLKFFGKHVAAMNVNDFKSKQDNS